METLSMHVKKIRDWLSGNEDRMGKGGKPIKSNITDNESAKMKTSHGVIQGYDGVTAVDRKHQMIVHAEHDLLMPMVHGVRENFKAIGKERDVFESAKLLANSGFHTEENMHELIEGEIDAYVADNLFRKRDPRFVGADRKERAQREGRSDLFTPRDFTFAGDLSHCICPSGKRLYRSGYNVAVRNFRADSTGSPFGDAMRKIHGYGEGFA